MRILGAVALAGALFLGSASAKDDTRWYAGLELGTGSASTEFKGDSRSQTQSMSANDFKLVVGKGTGNLVFTQAYYSSIKYGKDIWKDDKVTEFGVEAIKQFALHDKFYPMVKIGVGYGSAELPDWFIDDTIGAVSLTLGAGVDYKATDNISVMAGLDLNLKKWQDIEFTYLGSGITETIETSTTSTRLYVGANYRF